jgi:YbgC/YbaW family acyl-CoA thioester hydrolase
MSHVHTRRFRVRGYEVNGINRVHDRVLLDYVQQAAFEASADVGYDTRRYNALGTVWVIRRQTLVSLTAITYGDVIEIKTWVSDFRRVRSNREYELRRADGRVVALAQADWVYIDSSTLFPRRIPSDMVALFAPNGVSALEMAPPLEDVETSPGRPFTCRHRVKGYELDNLRHVNNAHYLDWLGQARGDALAASGFPPDGTGIQLQGLNVTPTLVRCEIEYLCPATVGDVLEVRSRVVESGRTQLTWEHQMMRGEERLVEAKATVCLQDDQGYPAPIPREVLQALLL